MEYRLTLRGISYEASLGEIYAVLLQAISVLQSAFPSKNDIALEIAKYDKFVLGDDCEVVVVG